MEESAEEEEEDEAVNDVSRLQEEFDVQIANLLVGDEANQESAAAQYVEESQESSTAEEDADRARERFVAQLLELKEGEDATPLLEEFIPALLPALKLGMRLIGRGRVVRFLARFLAKLIQRFVGPKYAPPLSRAIVDAGLRLIHLEASPQDEARIAAESIASTVEETVRQVVAQSDSMSEASEETLSGSEDGEDIAREMLEGTTLESFERAAASYLPPLLTEQAYEDRPELREVARVKGVWVRCPLRGRRRYRKYSRVFDVTITPHIARRIRTFGGVPLASFLRDRFAVAPGRTVRARQFKG
jgi:hypothetical protein